MTGPMLNDLLLEDMIGAAATALTWLSPEALAEDEDTAMVEARRILREAIDETRLAQGLPPVVRP